MRHGAWIVAALAVGACAGSGEQGEAGGSMRERPLVGSMEAKVTSSSVRFVFHVTNSGDTPVELAFSSSQRYDIVVESASGEEVWRWSEGMAFAQMLSQDTLAPDESWDMEAVWDPEGLTGEFVATGILAAREHDLRQSTTFQLQ